MHKEDIINISVILLTGLIFGVAMSFYWKDLAWVTLQVLAGLVELINWIL